MNLMNHANRGAQAFFDGWVPEFARAVEMFRGEPPEVTWELLPDQAGVSFDASILWWEQPFECGKSSSVWVGSPAETWNALSLGLADTADACRQLYGEMLGQSLQGAAHVLSAGRSERISCGIGAARDATPERTLIYGAVQVSLGSQALPAILAGMEPGFAQLLASEDHAEAAAMERSRDASSAEAKPLFERLIELELPISIVLGRTSLPIREVVKFTTGSLVELDRNVGDPVEIVVHNSVVARGEVVSVKGNYGVRIQEVISLKDRFALQASAKRLPVPALTQ